MEEIKKLEKKIQHLEYRLGVLERFLDDNGLIQTYAGERSDIDVLKLEVARDMKKEYPGFRIDSQKDLGRNFYNSK